MNNIVAILDRTVKKFPDKVGFIAGKRRLTFKEFDELVDRVASGLQNHGLRPGDHVALLLGVQLEFPVTFFALMKLGAVAVPLNTRFKGEELAFEINHSESKALIVDEEYWPFIDSVRGRLETIRNIFFNGSHPPLETVPFAQLQQNTPLFTPSPGSEPDTAAIMYTSGTTGRPKGAMLHQKGFVLTAMLVSDLSQFAPDDKVLCCIPLFHITGLACLMLPAMYSGVPCVYMRQFKTKEFLEVMAAERVTLYGGVINPVWLMINHPDFERYDFSNFKTALVGGSLATEEMVRGILKKLPRLRVSVGYGLTEHFAMATTTPYEDALRKIGAVGKCLPAVSAKIVDPAGNNVPAGGAGEILLKGPRVFTGYWKQPDITRSTIVDGWLHTGDIGRIDDEGFVYLLDRKKDMINRAGEKIYSLEIENVICDYPKVLEVAVVGVPDSMMGEVSKACIVLKPGEKATEREITEFCAGRLADYKVPKYVEFMASLPKNPSGKVNKPELRYVPAG